MCRRNQLLGIGLFGFGLGLLAAGLFESVFFCGCVGVGFLLVGVIVIQKK